MNLGYFNYPLPVNEPVLNYAPGSNERETLKKTLAALKSETLDIPMYIGAEEVRSGKNRPFVLLTRSHIRLAIFMLGMHRT
jgi:1-pyrroline-5-carboxylate dehydrogenase